MKKFKRILYIMIVFSLTVCSIPFSVEAASTIPVITSPVLYEEVPPFTNLTVSWSAPTSGTVDYYLIDVWQMRAYEEGEINHSPYILMNSEDVEGRSFVIPGFLLKTNGKYKIVLRAVMSTGSTRYAEDWYVHTGASKGVPSGSTLSFKVYQGFEDATKGAIYYSTRTWIDATGMEKVNTYSFDLGPTSDYYSVGDNVNVIVPINDPDEAMMVFKYWCDTNGFVASGDIVINKHYPWSNDLSPYTFDIQNVMTHEIGHAWGLSDKYDLYAQNWTMYGYEGNYCQTDARTLHSMDLLAIQQLYN